MRNRLIDIGFFFVLTGATILALSIGKNQTFVTIQFFDVSHQNARETCIRWGMADDAVVKNTISVSEIGDKEYICKYSVEK